jgi:hypothetical protein
MCGATTMAGLDGEAALDELAVQRILSFVNVPSGCLTCKTWNEQLHEQLRLAHRIRFHKLVRKAGSVGYHHSAVRAFGQDFEECVAYQFEFFADGSYTLQWNRSFGQWSASNQRQVGSWNVVGENLVCESVAGPKVPDNEVRYAPGGLIFALPIESVCMGNTAADGNDVYSWEYGIRGEPVPEIKKTFWEVEEHDARAQVLPQDPNARYVEIDGDLHEVSGDIRERYPEADWQRLMQCRVRFGLGN